VQCKSKLLDYKDEKSILKHVSNDLDWLLKQTNLMQWGYDFLNYCDKKMWHKMEQLFLQDEQFKDDAGSPL